jgi:hypothetical protein
MSYTKNDIYGELKRVHHRKLEFLLQEFDTSGFRFEITNLQGGLWPQRYAGAEWGVQVHSGAGNVGQAARWALNALREWAWAGVQPGRNYFAGITRKWASAIAEVPACLGSTIDWLYLFSKNVSDDPQERMYEVHTTSDRDLFNVYCWVFLGQWTPGGTTQVNRNSARGLHSLFWDGFGMDHNTSEHAAWKQALNESRRYRRPPGLGPVTDPCALHDQTHHFAAYFYMGANAGSNLGGDTTALFTGDQNARGQILNVGDYLLGLLAAQWGRRMRVRPDYIGERVARSLRGNCDWPEGPPYGIVRSSCTPAQESR